MAVVKEGDTVRVRYVGKLEDDKVFDSNKEESPLEIKVGGGEFLKGIEEGLIGMAPGESKTIFMGQAYGHYDKEKVFEFDRKRAPLNIDPYIGQQVQMHRADGKPVMVTVIGMTETTLTMDCNHPLAGKNLIYDITLEEIL